MAHCYLNIHYLMISLIQQEELDKMLSAVNLAAL